MSELRELKYCTTCMQERPKAEGEYIVSGRGNRARRWRCHICAAKKNRSFFAKPDKPLDTLDPKA